MFDQEKILRTKQHTVIHPMKHARIGLDHDLELLFIQSLKINNIFIGLLLR